MTNPLVSTVSTFLSFCCQFRRCLPFISKLNATFDSKMAEDDLPFVSIGDEFVEPTKGGKINKQQRRRNRYADPNSYSMREEDPLWFISEANELETSGKWKELMTPIPVEEEKKQINSQTKREKEEEFAFKIVTAKFEYLYSQSKYSEALEVLETKMIPISKHSKALSKGISQHSILFSAISCYIKLKKQSNAIEMAKNLTETIPKDSHAWRLLANSYTINIFPSSDSNSISIIVSQLDESHRKMIKEARLALTQSLMINPYNLSVSFELVRCLFYEPCNFPKAFLIVRDHCLHLLRGSLSGHSAKPHQFAHSYLVEKQMQQKKLLESLSLGQSTNIATTTTNTNIAQTKENNDETEEDLLMNEWIPLKLRTMLKSLSKVEIAVGEDKDPSRL